MSLRSSGLRAYLLVLATGFCPRFARSLRPQKQGRREDRVRAQLGVAALALLIGIINGVSQSQNLKPRVGYLIPSIVGTAFAQTARPTNSAPPAEVQIEDCLKRDSTVSQQIIRGVFGILPDDRWFVVVSSNLEVQTAISDVQAIQRTYSGKFQAKICGPVGGDSRYRVVIGENLTYEAAKKLEADAKAAGLPNDTWVWSPLQLSPS